jgi:energy-coupling factor transporter ATP-binding protein EcfA2
MDINKQMYKLTSHNIRMLICGPSASGKTTLVREMLYKHCNGIYHDIFVICPSLRQALWSDVAIKKENMSEEPTDAQFLSFLEKIAKNFEDDKRSLLIFDDCVNTEILKRTSELCKVWLRIRHYNCSVILISQNLKGVPPFIRSNLTHFITFHNSNRDEIKKMREEFGDKFVDNYNQYTKNPYSYVFADFNKNELSDERYRNKIKFDDDYYLGVSQRS